MAILNICKLYQSTCKGRCCEDTAIIQVRRNPNLPAEIKRELPMVNLIKPVKSVNNHGIITKSGWLFSCNNFDKETYLCKDFEHRPKMCQWYLCEEAVNILSLVNEPNEDLPW
jgi:hypothetical protein